MSLGELGNNVVKAADDVIRNMETSNKNPSESATGKGDLGSWRDVRDKIDDFQKTSPFENVSEATAKPLANSPLGKMSEGETLDKPMGEHDKPLGIKQENIEQPDRRELTPEEREYHKDKLGWTDDQMDKCTIDDQGVLHFKTINSDKEGTSNENGSQYVSKTVEINGVKVEGVFPEFGSPFGAELSEGQYKDSDKRQENECNGQLKEAVEKDPSLKEQFTDEQLEQIMNGDTPDDYTWHHSEEPGKMQLVKTEDHQAARHTGGRNIWGGGTANRQSTQI